MYDQEQIDKLLEEGRIVFNRKGVPRLKKMLSEVSSISVNDVWNDIDPLNSAAEERLGYPTQKPEALLERIISASSNEGDTILDAYCGCGTSVVVAQRLKRQWIGIDITYQSIALVVKRLEDSFGKTVTQEIELNGVPRDMESVRALVNKRDDRVRKEFEKWAILTYSDNRAVINEKKGADKGIDGVAYVAVGRDPERKDIRHSPVMLSVKSGKVGASVIRDLRGVVEREGAAGGILLTLEEPTKPMLEEARQAGQFKGDFATFDRLQIVTVQQILDGERMRLPLLAEVAKRAKAKSDARKWACTRKNDEESNLKTSQEFKPRKHTNQHENKQARRFSIRVI
jgi:site-specific DNA-methyltransferase (adenine-specific)